MLVHVKVATMMLRDSLSRAFWVAPSQKIPPPSLYMAMSIIIFAHFIIC